MRSFEAAAIGGCILAEDTADHRELFGPENQAVRYFKTVMEMVTQAKLLLADPELRCRLSLQLRKRMAAGRHTYADRLATMLRLSNSHDIIPPRECRIGNVASDCSDEGRFGSNIRVAITQ